MQLCLAHGLFIVAATLPYQGPARGPDGTGLAGGGAYDMAGTRRLDLSCGEQDKLRAAKEIRLVGKGQTNVRTNKS